jgi:phosphoglycerol transferase MdoB-like AlkP superfamily enzyme
LLLIALGLTAFCGWRGARAPDLRKGPRLAPWRLLMVTFAAVAMLLLVHLVNLLGVTTGRP